MHTRESQKISDEVWAKIDLKIIMAISQRELSAEGLASVIQNTVSRYSVTHGMLERRVWKVITRIPDVHFHIPKKQKCRKGTSHKHPHHAGYDALDIDALCRHVRKEIPDVDDDLITAVIHRLLD